MALQRMNPRGTGARRETGMTRDQPKDQHRDAASKTGSAPSAHGAANGAAGGAAACDKDERTARLEQALRANLRRRKAQSRARAETDPPAKGAGDPE